jgi:hypothetical protein
VRAVKAIAQEVGVESDLQSVAREVWRRE